jgi:hypothetical protein
MKMIIGPFLTQLNSWKTMASVLRRDDNSRTKVQNVREDSSAACPGSITAMPRSSTGRVFAHLEPRSGR